MTNRKNDPRRECENTETFPTEKQVENVMKEMSVRPSVEVKQKSLQKALVGMRTARKSHRRRRRMNKWKNWTRGLLGVGVVTAALLFLILNMDELQEGLSGDLNTGDTDPPAQETEDALDSMDLDVDRAEEKDIITYPEGMETEERYQLLNEDPLPFTTYIPLDWESEAIETDTVTGVRLEPVEFDYGEIDIGFFQARTTEEEAREGFADMVAEYRETEALPREDEGLLADWALESFAITDERIGTLTLGFADQRYFYICSTYIPEAGDGWGSIEAVMYDEWRWKETDEPLEEESRLEWHMSSFLE